MGSEREFRFGQVSFVDGGKMGIPVVHGDDSRDTLDVIHVQLLWEVKGNLGLVKLVS